MKKIGFAIVAILVLSGIVLTLQQNKARSEAKVKSIVDHRFTVSISPVRMADIGDSLVVIGTVAPERQVAIASETIGKIRSISAEVGTFKGRGGVIATVDAELKQASVMSAEANLEKARKDLERYQAVQVENALPDQQIDNARLAVRLAEANLITARRALRDTRIRAPFSGVIATRSAQVGTMVQPGMVIATLVDISSLKIRLSIPEKDVVSMHIGDEALVTCDLYPGVIFGGRVVTIGTGGDEAHTFPVEVSIANRSSHPLKVGMFTRVHFRGSSTRPALVIPRSAIVGGVKAPKVYVLEGGSRVALRSITIGAQSGTDVEVLSGLKAGENVVRSGHNNLRDGMSVNIGK